jgi:hypothetical protein
MNKKLLLIMVILVLIAALYFFSGEFKKKSQLQDTSIIHNSAPALSPVAHAPFARSTFFQGQTTKRVFVSTLNHHTVSFKDVVAQDVAHQSRNPVYKLLVDQEEAGETMAQDILQPTFSPDESYFAFRTMSVCGATCLDFNVIAVDVSDNTLTTIRSPRKEKDYAGERSGLGYTINPFIDSYTWESDHVLNLIFYFVGTTYHEEDRSETYERVSPKEVWQYDLTTNEYAFVKTLPESNE